MGPKETIPVDNFGTVVGENPDCLLLSGTVVKIRTMSAGMYFNKISLIFGPLNFHNPHPNQVLGLQTIDTYASKIAKICNFWTFRLVIQLIKQLFKIRAELKARMS